MSGPVVAAFIINALHLGFLAGVHFDGWMTRWDERKARRS